jgi:hypothetical protein
MTQQLSAEAVKQAGIALHRAAEGLKAVGDALIILSGESFTLTATVTPQQNLNEQGGVASPPKVEGEAAARGRRKANADSPPPPAAATPAPPPPAAPAALDYERDVKPLVVELYNKNVAALGQPKAVEFGKALLQRYGADTFAPNGRPGSKPVDPSQYPKLTDEIKRLLAGEDTGVVHGTADNDLGL